MKKENRDIGKLTQLLTMRKSYLVGMDEQKNAHRLPLVYSERVCEQINSDILLVGTLFKGLWLIAL